MAWEPVRADPEPVLPGFGAWEPYTAMQSRTNSPVGHRNTSTSSEASLTDDLPRTQNTAQTDEPSGRDAPYSFMLATPTAQVKAQMHVKLLSAELSRPSLGHWCWQGLGRSIILAVVAMPTGYVGRCATNLSRDDQVRSPGHMGYHQAAWGTMHGGIYWGGHPYPSSHRVSLCPVPVVHASTFKREFTSGTQVLPWSCLPPRRRRSVCHHLASRSPHQRDEQVLRVEQLPDEHVEGRYCGFARQVHRSRAAP